MTTPSEALTPVAPERRLHPLSWLFVLVQQLRQFALPLLVLLLTGRGNTWELWGLVGVGVLAAVSVAQYFTYRFRIEADGIVIRSGLLQRSLRHIPFQRIHNVALHQSLLHRLAGVADVRLESAGGVKAEGEMRVLSLADAHALEDLVRHRGAAAPDTDAPAAPAARVLLALPTSEIVRQGLISNRGMLVVAGALGLMAQAGADLLGDAIAVGVDSAAGWGRGLDLGALGAALGFGALLLLALAGLRVLSVALALLQYHGFVLSEDDGRLSLQRGLLTRVRANMPRTRIQAWSLHESLTHRWFGRRTLRVDSASLETAGETRSLRDLAPVITPAAADALVRELLPGRAWPPAAWRPLHPLAWRRAFTVPALATLAATGLLVSSEGAGGLWLLALLPLWLLRARVWARHAGYSEDGGLIAVREGWLDRRWRFADVRKLQSLRLSQTPFDRRLGMATLMMDTAGASPLEPPLRVRYLPEDKARALHDRLAAAMDAPLTPARTPG